MKRIALSAGHWPKARGACSGEVCEHEQAAYWCALIGRHLDAAGVQVYHVPTGPLRDKVEDINRAGVDAAIEVHFNACGGCGAQGAETLYYPGSRKGETLATAIQRGMVGAGAVDRGVKEGWYKQDYPDRIDYAGDVDGDERIDYFLEATRMPAVIVEPEFIEMHMTFDRIRNDYCRAIADGIIDYLEG